jgi:hypothetical protein
LQISQLKRGADYNVLANVQVAAGMQQVLLMLLIFRGIRLTSYSSPIYQRPCRNPNYAITRRNTVDDHRAGADYRSTLHDNSLPDHRSGSDVSSAADLYLSCEPRTGGNMDIVGNRAVMFDNRTGVDEDVAAKHGTGIDDRPREDLTARTESAAR